MAEKTLEIIRPYCENEMRRLKNMSRSIFTRFNIPLSESDHDDFFSIANLTLWQAYNAFDPDLGVSFGAFLYSCLKRKFASEVKKRYREKRLADRNAVSLDASLDEEEGCNLYELIPSDFDVFEEMMETQEGGQYQNKVQNYISRLSRRQVDMLNLLIDGYRPAEIRQILEITPVEYSDSLKVMRSYENVKFLL